MIMNRFFVNVKNYFINFSCFFGLRVSLHTSNVAENAYTWSVQQKKCEWENFLFFVLTPGKNDCWRFFSLSSTHLFTIFDILHKPNNRHWIINHLNFSVTVFNAIVQQRIFFFFIKLKRQFNYIYNLIYEYGGYIYLVDMEICFCSLKERSAAQSVFCWLWFYVWNSPEIRTKKHGN